MQQHEKFEKYDDDYTKDEKVAVWTFAALIYIGMGAVMIHWVFG